MAEGNHLCETAKCPNSASAFGLSGPLKLRSCNEHITSLLIKQMTIYSIERYEFISTQQDAILFEERKGKVERGLSNLTVQEANVDLEQTAALQLLEAEKAKLLRQVEDLFLEIREAVTNRHSEVKRQLVSLEVNLNQYLQRRENSLFPGAELLCTDMKSTPLFIQLRLEGVSDEVVRAIKKYWSTSSANIESFLQTAGLEPPSIEAADKLSCEGQEFEHSKQLKKAESCYFQAKRLYDLCAPQSASAGTNLYRLGRLLADAERWSESRKYCRQAQAIFEVSASTPLETADNLAALGWVSYRLGSVGKAVNYCQKAKSIYDTLQAPGVSVAVNLRNFGLVRCEEKRYAEAEEFYKQAQRICEEVAPLSVDAAMVYHNTGALCYTLNRKQEAEEHFAQALLIFQVKAPQSCLMADCLYNMALIHEANGRIEKAITTLQSVAELYGLCKNSEWKEKIQQKLLQIQVRRSKGKKK